MHSRHVHDRPNALALGVLGLMAALGGAASSVDGAATIIFGVAAMVILAILWMLTVGWGRPAEALNLPKPRTFVAAAAAPVVRRRVIVRMPAPDERRRAGLPMGRVVHRSAPPV